MRLRSLLGSVLFLLESLSVTHLSAQSSSDQEVPPNLGFIRLMNAIGEAGQLKISINNEETNPGGYPMGEATGALGLPEGSYQVSLDHETLGKERVSMTLKKGQISTLVVFQELKQLQDQNNQLAKVDGKAVENKPTLAWHVDESPTSPPDTINPILKLLQFTPAAELAFSVDKVPAITERGKPNSVAITQAMGAFPEVVLAGKSVCLLNFKAPADQLVVFFTGPGGILKHAVMRNDVQ